MEWPIFAILGIYFWWMLIHTDYDTVGLKGMRNQTATVVAAAARVNPSPSPPEVPYAPGADHSPDIDPELAAYNARLAALSAIGPKTWRNPETVVARRPR